MTSIREAGYPLQCVWVKEFMRNGKLHVHALINVFIPQGVVKHLWYLGTDCTSYIVWIAAAQVQYAAAYMTKYMTKDMLIAPFRKGERRYGMSKLIRQHWPRLKRTKDEMEVGWTFFYKPDNTRHLNMTHTALEEKIRNIKQMFSTNSQTNQQKNKSKSKRFQTKTEHLLNKHKSLTINKKF